MRKGHWIWLFWRYIEAFVDLGLLLIVAFLVGIYSPINIMLDSFGDVGSNLRIPVLLILLFFAYKVSKKIKRNIVEFRARKKGLTPFEFVCKDIGDDYIRYKILSVNLDDLKAELKNDRKWHALSRTYSDIIYEGFCEIRRNNANDLLNKLKNKREEDATSSNLKSEEQHEEKEFVFCPNCGSKISKDNRYCPNCGNKIPH